MELNGACSLSEKKECDACSYEDTHARAYAYCDPCEEFLCNPCYNVHKKMKVSREHRIHMIEELCGHKHEMANGCSTPVENGTETNGHWRFDVTGEISIHKLDHNEEAPLILGLGVLDENTLVAADYTNSEVKLIFTSGETSQSIAILPETPPYDVTAPDESTVCVACGFKNYVVKRLNQKDTWKLAWRIHFKDTYYCTAVTHSDVDSLFFAVTKPIPFVLKTDIAGNILFKIRMRDEENVPYPHAIDYCQNTANLYVSDFTGNCLTEIQENRRQTKVGKFAAPTSIAADGNGDMFVISEGRVQVFRLNDQSTSQISTLCSVTNGTPTALTYDKSSNKLYVSFDSNKILSMTDCKTDMNC